MGIWDKYGHVKKGPSGRKASSLEPGKIKNYNVRIHDDIAFDFTIACRLAGVIQQTIIKQWMEDFIEKIHQEVGEGVWQQVKKNEQMKRRLKK